jgi:predicted nucleic acid-binding protein
MAVYFVDTSALVKRYVAEVGSSWLIGVTDPAAGNSCWLAAITRVEVVAAFYLRARTGSLSLANAWLAERQFRHELQTHYRRVGLQARILNRAMRLVRDHPLRAADAMQLGCALYLQARQAAAGLPPPILLSADHNLNRAAAAEGMSFDDPNSHP